MHSPEHDLTNEELGRIVARLGKAFRDRPAWPIEGLQYRAGEGGRNRIDPRQLRRALAELSNNRRPRRGQIGEPGPWEPITGTYVSADMSLEEARDCASLLVDDTERFRALDRIEILDRLQAELEVATGIFVRAETPTDASAERRPGSVCAFGDTHDLVSPRHGVVMWLTHETDWLYPDNPYLWQFLTRCFRHGFRPLVVARKIHQTTFILFESLDIRGVQYFSTLVPEEDFGELGVIAQRIGWIHARSVEEIAHHKVIGHIESSVRHLESHPTNPTAEQVMQVASTLGLDSAAGPQALLSWVRECGTKFPKWWMTAVERWEEWDAYRAPRRPGCPSSAVSEKPKYTPPEDSRRSDLTHRSPPQTDPRPDPLPEASEGEREHNPFGRETKVSRVPLRLR